jgi:hypothetical protein
MFAEPSIADSVSDVLDAQYAVFLRKSPRMTGQRPKSIANCAMLQPGGC